MLPDVIVEVSSGNLGALLQTDDGIAGYILTGVSAGSIVQGTPFSVKSLQAAEALGLINATNAFAYKVVKEHYDVAPNTEVYLLIVPNTMTVAQMCDKTNANGAIKLLDFAAGKIKLLGAMYLPSVAPTVTNFIDPSCYTAKTNMQALAVEYAGTGKQAPFWGFIGGTHVTGADSTLTDQTASTDGFVSIVIGDTVSGNGCALGQVVGSAALNPVQRKISRVKNGALPVTTMYIGATLVEKYTTISTIHDKAYITFRTFPGKNGYFIANDFTCTPTTNDFHSGCNLRVMNKCRRIGYAVFVDEIDDEVPITTDGKIDASYAKYLEDRIETQINGTMTANRAISSFEAYVDPEQNVLSSSETVVVLAPVPVGYNSKIRAKIGFKNPAL